MGAISTVVENGLFTDIKDIVTNEVKASTGAIGITGAIVPFAGTDAPAGWLLCDGSEVSRVNYSKLFDVIGTAYGSGDGETTFNLPDLREAMPKGIGSSSKSSTHGTILALGDFQDDQMQSHTHTFQSVNYVYMNPRGSSATIQNTQAETTTNGPAGDTTEVKAVVMNYIIRSE